jgi:ubiquinone/menaquinone biosynthesis C-methylase UbiE
MKVPDSGMPAETYWESLFDVPLILDRMGIDNQVQNVVELGCGYGTFTVPVAQRVKGMVFAFDIEPEMIARTTLRADGKAPNIGAQLRDVLRNGFRLPDESCDAVLLFNILHCPQPEKLLIESSRVLRTGGRVLVIHWRSDLPTPRGPALEIRPKPETVHAAALLAGLAPEPAILLPPWHFGVVLRWD